MTEHHVEPTADDSTHPVFWLEPLEAEHLQRVILHMADERRGFTGLLPSRRRSVRILTYIASHIAAKAAHAHENGEPLIEYEAPTYVKYWVLRAMEEHDIDIPSDRVRWVENPHFAGDHGPDT